MDLAKLKGWHYHAVRLRLLCEKGSRPEYGFDTAMCQDLIVTLKGMEGAMAEEMDRIEVPSEDAPILDLDKMSEDTSKTLVPDSPAAKGLKWDPGANNGKGGWRKREVGPTEDDTTQTHPRWKDLKQ